VLVLFACCTTLPAQREKVAVSVRGLCEGFGHISEVLAGPYILSPYVENPFLEGGTQRCPATLT
jgi:hypothetical protein